MLRIVLWARSDCELGWRGFSRSICGASSALESREEEPFQISAALFNLPALVLITVLLKVRFHGGGAAVPGPSRWTPVPDERWNAARTRPALLSDQHRDQGEPSLLLFCLYLRFLTFN